MLDARLRQHGRSECTSLREDVGHLSGQCIWKVVGHGALQVSHPVLVARLVSDGVVVGGGSTAHSRTLELEDVNGFRVTAAAQVLLARRERERRYRDAAFDAAPKFKELSAVIDLKGRRRS